MLAIEHDRKISTSELPPWLNPCPFDKKLGAENQNSTGDGVSTRSLTPVLLLLHLSMLRAGDAVHASYPWQIWPELQVSWRGALNEEMHQKLCMHSHGGERPIDPGNACNSLVVAKLSLHSR